MNALYITTQKGCVMCHVTSLNFGEYTDNSSLTVQDRDMLQ